MSGEKPSIIYTLTDEAPLLATYAFLPVVRTFAGAAGIDEGGGAAARRQRVGVDAQGRAAPIDMGVQVDQARDHEPAAGVEDLPGAFDRQPGLQGGDAAVAEPDIELPVDPGTGIDHPTVADYEIEQLDPPAGAGRRAGRAILGLS